MYRYQAFAERLNNNIGEHTAYGIVILEEVCGSMQEILRVSDISEDKTAVENLAKMCESHQVAPSHIYDIIEDSLYST